MTTAFFRYTDPLNPLKAVTILPYGGAVLVGAWFDGVTFQLGGSTVSLAPVSGSGNFGYASSHVDSSGVASYLRFQSTFQTLDASGVVRSFLAPSGAVQTALFNGMFLHNNTPYISDVSGNVYTFSPLTASGTVSKIGAFGTPTRGLVGTPNFLYAAAPNSGAFLAQMPFATPAATGRIATPMTVPAAVASSGGLIAVGGWSNTSIVSGFFNIAGNPVNANFLAGLTTGSAGISSFTESVSGVWGFQQHVANTGAGTQLQWTPLGNTLFAANTASGTGTIDVYGLSVNTLTFNQALGIAGVSGLAVASDSTHALAFSPGAGQVTSIYSVGSGWAVSGAVAMGNPRSAITLPGGATALVGNVSGLSLMTLFGNQWQLTSTTTLHFVPLYLAYSALNNSTFAAGVSGASGAIYSTATALSGTYVGGCSGLVVFGNQVIMLDPTGKLQFIDPNTLSVAASAAIASGAQCIAAIGSELLIGYATQTLRYTLGAPYSLQAVKTGAVSIYTEATSGWVTATLSPAQIPEALTFDTSGNISVATLSNYLLTITTAAAVSSVVSIPVFSGQVANTPLGISSLRWINGSLYASSILNNAIIQVA